MSGNDEAALHRPSRAPRAAVVGGGLGGLSAAVHLRLAGWEVDLFEAGERVGGRANRLIRDGFTWDTGPSLLNYPWLFQDFFRRAGRDLADYVELLPVEPALTFVWRDGDRLALSTDFERLGAELERFDPGAREGLAAFLADAGRKYSLAFDKLVTRNADSVLGWLTSLSLAEAGRLSLGRSLYAELARFFAHPRIPEALGCYAMYLGGSPFDLPGIYSLLPYGEIAHGLWLPRGGMYALVEAVARLATELGVRLHTGCRVTAIETVNRRVSGLRFADGAVFEASVVVSNVDLPTTDSELLAAAPGARARERRARRLRMTPGVVTFYWGVRGRVPGLLHHTVFLPDDYRRAFDQLARGRRVPDDLPFYVSVASATDPSLAPPGDSAVFVLVPTPVLSDCPGLDWEAEVERLKRMVLERLVAQGVELPAAAIVTEEVWSPVEWSRRCGLYDGSAFGAAHGFFQVGPFRPRNYDRKLDGLYYAGASTTPGTGLPMVLLSGRLAAERVVEREGRAEPRSGASVEPRAQARG